MRNILFLIMFFPFTVHAWNLGELGEFHFDKVNSDVYVMHGPLGEPSKRTVAL